MALARFEGAGDAPAPSCRCATLPKLPYGFRSFPTKAFNNPSKLLILLVRAGRLEPPRPLGQQILSRATFALDCPDAIQKRPRGDRKTGITTQPFVAWTFETVSGQVHDRSKWVRVKNKPRAGP